MRLLTPRSPEIEGPFAGTYRAYRPSISGRFHMFAWLVILAGIAGYLYYRWHGPVMHESVRSHVYLEALREGVANAEANQLAALNESEVTHAMRHHAKCHRLYLYAKPVLGSKLWPQIGDAYKRGMTPLLPEILWDWLRSTKYEFPSVLRSKQLVRTETEYESYYASVLSALGEETDLASQHVARLINPIEDQSTREAFNAKISAVDWARTLCERHLRDGNPAKSAA